MKLHVFHYLYKVPYLDLIPPESEDVCTRTRTRTPHTVAQSTFWRTHHPTPGPVFVDIDHPSLFHVSAPRRIRDSSVVDFNLTRWAGRVGSNRIESMTSGNECFFMPVVRSLLLSTAHCQVPDNNHVHLSSKETWSDLKHPTCRCFPIFTFAHEPFRSAIMHCSTHSAESALYAARIDAGLA